MGGLASWLGGLSLGLWLFSTLLWGGGGLGVLGGDLLGVLGLSVSWGDFAGGGFFFLLGMLGGLLLSVLSEDLKVVCPGFLGLLPSFLLFSLNAISSMSILHRISKFLTL